MSENKCPFCGEAMLTTKDQIVVCENADCATMFNEWDYPKACAAMELAKWTIAINLTSSDDPTAGDIAGKHAEAEQRVLEVFGK